MKHVTQLIYYTNTADPITVFINILSVTKSINHFIIIRIFVTATAATLVNRVYEDWEWKNKYF